MKNKLKQPKRLDEVYQLKNQLARALADYDNLRKRVEKEKEILEKIISAKVIIKILPIFDMLEEAQKHLSDSGIALVLEEFKNVLKDEGVEKIRVDKGTKFDTNLHEAVEVIMGGENSVIVEEVLSGWKSIDGDIIRPSKVKVYGENVEEKKN